ncbi:prephenate dehydrogenase [Nocardioides marinquilinus]|uniref:Prephenate dehydrogenase n=1 Tax=Nocardioides marinquilinus TaxID=1210400 RepID=A0ABP9PIC2_9ACTN
MTFARVAVVGAGLIGGSVVRRLRALGRDVVLVDPAVPGAAPAVPSSAGLVVVAVPLDAMAGVLREVASAAPDAVVVDVGSVKGPVAASAATAGLAGRYVGAHPMAGTEHSGFEHSDPDLLVGATWAVTRGDGPVADVVAWLLEVFDATVALLDPDQHDRAVALASHLPHVLANALLELVHDAPDGDAAALLAAGSFRDATRVGGGNAARSRNLLAGSPALPGVLDELLALLTAYRAELGDPASLGARLERVSAGAAGVRRPDVAWTPCPDVDAALAHPGPALVRPAAEGLEWAAVRGAPGER